MGAPQVVGNTPLPYASLEGLLRVYALVIGGPWCHATCAEGITWMRASSVANPLPFPAYLRDGNQMHQQERQRKQDERSRLGDRLVAD